MLHPCGVDWLSCIVVGQINGAARPATSNPVIPSPGCPTRKKAGVPPHYGRFSKVKNTGVPHRRFIRHTSSFIFLRRPIFFQEFRAMWFMSEWMKRLIVQHLRDLENYLTKFSEITCRRSLILNTALFNFKSRLQNVANRQAWVSTKIVLLYFALPQTFFA